MSRRKLLGATCLAAASTTLGACILPGSRATPKAPASVQLVYQDARADWFPPMVQRMLEAFHSTHPNIRVFYTPEPENSEDIEEKTLAAMQAGTAPDVFQGCCSWFPIWAQKGYALDLRAYVQSDLDASTIADWDPAQYRSFFTRDGLEYGLPKYHGALALYFNKDLFDEHGVGYPDASWSHEEYLSAMRRLTRDRDGDGRTDLWGSMTYVTWDRIQMHVNGWGGHLVDPDDPAKCRMGDPEALAALEWLRTRMWDDKVMATTLDVQKKWPDEAFVANQIAMLEDGSWRLKYILDSAKFRVGVAPFPAGPARRVTLASTDGFGIYSGTRQADAAWELVKFLIGKDFGREMARASFLQPARASLVEDWVGLIREEYPEKARDVDVAAFADGHLKGYSVTSEVAANMAEATRLANAAWDQILTMGKAPVDLMKTVCPQIAQSQETLRP